MPPPQGNPIPKFWVLETVARIPYFAYISILHLYESVGFWRAGAELRKIHFAEVRVAGCGAVTCAVEGRTLGGRVRRHRRPLVV